MATTALRYLMVHPRKSGPHTLMTNRAEPIIRCPYCRVANEFRQMAERIEGWFRCESCGHNAMPLDPEFNCACSKCASAQSRSSADWF